MAEPEALHPFSNHFRSQLSDVLSRPNHIKQATKDKQYLETEIDSYSGVEFGQHKTKACSSRTPTPPKPAHRTFTFEKTNPFAKPGSEANTLSLPKYAEVIKPKRRPRVAPKPKFFSVAETLPISKHYTVPHEQPKITIEDTVPGIYSLPDLSPPTTTSDDLRASSWNRSMRGYGKPNQMRTTVSSEHVTATNDTKYCDVLPETPNSNNAGTARVSNYDDVYEDVDSIPNASNEPKLQTESLLGDGSDSDYTLMCSPSVSEINNFTFARKSFYENTAAIHSPSSNVFYNNDYENMGAPTFEIGDPNRVGVPNNNGECRIPAESNDHASPTSSYDDHDSYAYSVQSSMLSTTASSFQSVQVCYFPPSPPSEFYQGNTTVERPESVSSGCSKKSNSSRSRIPIPIKSKNPASLSLAKVSDQQSLPPTPTPSPVVPSKKKVKNTNDIKLSPPGPAGNEQVEPISGKGVTSSAKGARWYEKLGCIQTDTIQPSEPYGLPGERKRSKSLNREQRKSHFFLTVNPKESDPPTTQRSQH